LKTEQKRDDISASGYSFAIVVSRWNASLTAKLVSGAVKALTAAGAGEDQIKTFHVPGAFELPLAALKAAESGRFDAIIALGIVIRGDTPHFDYVAGQAAAGIMQASMTTGVPVLFGVITADNMEQAVARSGENEDNKGYEAAVSAIEMAAVIAEITGRSEIF
jgi:6,7-dimethyl-8-ribityllumazine synthase